MSITLLWQPPAARVKRANITRFSEYANKHCATGVTDYPGLHDWSINHPEEFWKAIWDFCGVIGDPASNRVLSNGEQMPGAEWFPDATLNFAENLLRYADERCALISRLENGERRTLSYAELRQQVAQLAAAFKARGIQRGDRVAAFMPNILETVIGMLAASSIGAIWSSCSPDFGINGVLDRFGQIEPKLLLACDGYYYNGKVIDVSERLRAIVEKIDSIRTVVIVPVLGRQEALALKTTVELFDDFLTSCNTAELQFEALPFNHPLYVMYSSGTTGVPKCIVHGAGGTLLQHLKEQRLHVDLQRDDVFYYFTTCGWMMWNWLISGLASGATLLLYDGSPFFPRPEALIDMIDEENISIFGSSAKYIAALEKADVKPKESHQLTRLKTILSTGSPLSHESFRYVYRDVKEDVCLSSISGGTDIVSCFALGNSCLPVYEGELQCRGLGMAVEIWDAAGNSVVGEKGELVCTAPFPSMPIYFWHDVDNAKFRAAYFEQYSNAWSQGDYGEVTEHGGMIIHGRSDAVLNPGGVRIGTAEIYRQVAKIDEVLESICVGQDWQDDVRIVLFVVLREGVSLTGELRNRIRQTIRTGTTARHVPDVVMQVADIPRTISGKIVELAVRNVIHGRPVKNTDALANPLSLKLFENLAELE